MHIADERIHPELRARGRLIRRVLPSFNKTTLKLGSAATRAIDAMRIWPGKSPRPHRVILRRSDGDKLALSVFEPVEGARPGAPVVLWIHGGGFALGAPFQDYSFIDRFVDAGCTVVAPSYRHSVCAPFPAAFNDCYRALDWARDELCGMGSKARPLAVGGNSAGGNLCVAVCLRARDKGLSPIRFQMPLYPMLDCRMESPSSQGNDAPVWNSASNEAAWSLYAGMVPGDSSSGRGSAWPRNRAISAYMSPALADDLSGMPPCCTYVGDIDPFHDETVEYVQKLRSAGVAVDFREFEGCFHGFDIICPDSSPAQQAAAFLMESFKRHML